MEVLVLGSEGLKLFVCVAFKTCSVFLREPFLDVSIFRYFAHLSIFFHSAFIYRGLSTHWGSSAA